MEIRLTLQPGQRGTKRLVEQFGEQLVCVRYRYDAQRQKRFTTVELVVAEGAWQNKPAKNQLVFLKLERHERDWQRKVKAAGGQWLTKKNLWQLTYEQALALGLGKRIQLE